MKPLATHFLLYASIALAGCGGSGSGSAKVGQSTPVPANGRLLFHGVLRSDINLANFPAGGTGKIYVYDDVTGRLQAELPAENGAHLDAASVPAGHAVRVFFVPRAAAAP